VREILVSQSINPPPGILQSVGIGSSSFLIVVAMTFGLILPRMLFQRRLPSTV
jgi:hypothetical protein